MPTMKSEPPSEHIRNQVKTNTLYVMLAIAKADGRELDWMLADCDDEILQQVEMSISIVLRERNLPIPPYAHNDD